MMNKSLRILKRLRFHRRPQQFSRVLFMSQSYSSSRNWISKRHNDFLPFHPPKYRTNLTTMRELELNPLDPLASFYLRDRVRRRKAMEKILMSLTISKIRQSGILASDENAEIMESRFKKIGVENNEENRRAYRDVIYKCPGLEKYVGGAILCRETFDQKSSDGTRFVQILKDKGISVGVCVDKMWKVDPKTGESVTLGMDSLAKECRHAKKGGADFVKWRTVFHMNSENTSPSKENMKKNIDDILKYVKTAQAYGLVPIVEPEVSVFSEDSHTLEQVYEVTKTVLDQVFRSLEMKKDIDISRIILKPNMVVCKKILDHPRIVGEMTVSAFNEARVPDGMTICFLSGGMNEKQSAENLNQVAKKNDESVDLINKNWRFSYSFGRALQESCRNVWRGEDENVEEARKAFMRQARDCYFASFGVLK